jgi:hypothetical protein
MPRFPRTVRRARTGQAMALMLAGGLGASPASASPAAPISWIAGTYLTTAACDNAGAQGIADGDREKYSCLFNLDNGVPDYLLYVTNNPCPRCTVLGSRRVNL